MNYFIRNNKGSYLYIKKQTIFEIIKTVFLFAMALGIFFIGYKTLGTKKSLWSVIAVLGLLPASKSLVETIMFLRFRSLNYEVFKIISDAAQNLPILYENIITTAKSTYFIDSLCYAKGSMILYYDGDIKNNKYIETHFSDVLKAGGHKNVSIKIYNNVEDYIIRLNEINEHFNDEVISANAIFNTIRAVSL